MVMVDFGWKRCLGTIATLYSGGGPTAGACPAIGRRWHSGADGNTWKGILRGVGIAMPTEAGSGARRRASKSNKATSAVCSSSRTALVSVAAQVFRRKEQASR